VSSNRNATARYLLKVQLGNFAVVDVCSAGYMHETKPLAVYVERQVVVCMVRQQHRPKLSAILLVTV